MDLTHSHAMHCLTHVFDSVMRLLLLKKSLRYQVSYWEPLYAEATEVFGKISMLAKVSAV